MLRVTSPAYGLKNVVIGRRQYGRGDGWGSGREAEAVEDLSDCIRWIDRSQEKERSSRSTYRAPVGRALLAGPEGLEMGGHHAVEDALFRPAGAVLAGGFADGDAPAASREEAVRGRMRPSDEPVAA